MGRGGAGTDHGLATALLLPLGPTTPARGFAVVLTGLLIGFAGGRVTGSAWSVLPLAAVHGVAVELGRWSVALPTVDAVRVDSAYGVLALLAGRGVHVLLLVPPMVLGALVGAAATGAGASARPSPVRWSPRWSSPSRGPRPRRRCATPRASPCPGASRRSRP